MDRDLFALTVPLKDTNVLFQRLLHRGHRAARTMMNEVLSSLDQVEGGFVRDFQTSGFSARVAELALFAYLHEQELELDRAVPSPDFVVRGSRPVAIEATTTNPPDDKAPNEDFTLVPTELSADDRAF